MVVDTDVFADDAFQNFPMRHGLFVISRVVRIVHVTWVDEFPTQELRAVDTQWDGLEYLNVFRVAVEYRVWENHIVTN